VLRFEPLTPDEVKQLVERALHDSERGLGKMRISLASDALDHLVQGVNGDARRAINALDLVVAGLAPESAEPRTITLEAVEEALQQRALQYDRDGDMHYDIISAYIKSMRGSDPDAALYWLARMIKAGEDPRFIARRLVIQAAEDVGNADPVALMLATAAANAVEYVGLPEAQIPLAQATIYVATAPKSNASYLAIARAMDDVSSLPPGEVPRSFAGCQLSRSKENGSRERVPLSSRLSGSFRGAGVSAPPCSITTLLRPFRSRKRKRDRGTNEEVGQVKHNHLICRRDFVIPRNDAVENRDRESRIAKNEE